MKNLIGLIFFIIGSFLVKLSFIDTKRAEFRKDYRYDRGLKAFYKLHTDAVSWHHALIRCEAEGTKLLAPVTLDEADSMMLLITQLLPKYGGVYIGIHDLYSERSFVTLRGRPIQNTLLDLLWDVKEPTYGGGRCVGMRRNGKLFVNHCSDKLPFICKKKHQNIVVNKDCESFDLRWKLGPNSTCYMVHVEKQNWYDAFATCVGAGGRLAIPDMHDDTEYLGNLYKRDDKQKLSTDTAFLGFSDLLERYHYRTVMGDSLTINQSEWESQMPVCPGTKETHVANRCGAIGKRGIIVVNCYQPSTFICEKQLNNTQTKEGNRKKLN